MKAATELGIWMDHSNAHLMEFSRNPIETKTIAFDFSHHKKEQNSSKNENLLHNKEQHEQAAFYKSLSDVIKNYDAVILFGPTEAKTELYNILKENQHFSNIKIKVKPADKMTENQQHAFVKEYFSTS